MAKSAPEAASIPAEVLAKYEPVIGLEVHVQLLTKSKIFCGCSTHFGDPPNSNVCPICLGLPGTLPVLNKRVVELAMRAALSLNCTIHEHSRFARKNYFYPDLPKGYQISQYELPLATNGWFEIDHVGEKKRIGITRLHLEEDAAKNLHEGFPESATKAYIDYNRCGTPLSEIVSEPDMRTPEEAYAYLTTLRQIMLYTGVSDCNMEEGSLRCDANVSVRLRGAKEFGTKVEVKNLNSFRFLQKALEYEIERHIGVLESGGRISQETRLWNQSESVTVSMRSKEKAHDYRYFPEPDLLPVHVSSAWREDVLRSLPELPGAKRNRFISSYGLSNDEAAVLTDEQQYADYFEAVVRSGADAKQTAAWMQRLSALAERTVEAHEIVADKFGNVAAGHFAELIQSVVAGKITATNARTVLTEMFETGKPPAEIIASKGLTQVQDDSEIELLASKVIADNAAKIEDYRLGSQGIAKFLVGQAMKASKGRANPQILNKKLSEKLKEQHEKAMAESFFPLYNNLRSSHYQFVRTGAPPEPDLIFGGPDGILGVEITSTYLNQDEAKWLANEARGAGGSPVWSSGVISQPDAVYASQLFRAISGKLQKTYSVQPTLLIVDFNYPLGDSAEAAELVKTVGEKVRMLGPGPFVEIWAVWQITNILDVRFQVFAVI
jgi:aspartyl-tRNA(Asn)/glutamyl-tRNA(Gln) amidotransferase subunit B